MTGLPPKAEILNESLQHSSIPVEVLRAFRGHRATRRLLEINHKLYKFTSYPLFGPEGKVTPFWSSVEPIAPGDPGWAESQRRAAHVDASPVVTARARAAVTHQWNSMRGQIRARLRTPVYAFVGQCSGQRIDAETDANVFFIGGAWQLWIPNLTSRHIALDGFL